MEQQLFSTSLQEDDIVSATDGSETNVRRPWLRFAGLALFLFAAAALWGKIDPVWHATDGSMVQTVLGDNSCPPGWQFQQGGSPAYSAAGAAYPPGVGSQGYPPASSLYGYPAQGGAYPPGVGSQGYQLAGGYPPGVGSQGYPPAGGPYGAPPPSPGYGAQPVPPGCVPVEQYGNSAPPAQYGQFPPQPDLSGYGQQPPLSSLPLSQYGQPPGALGYRPQPGQQPSGNLQPQPPNYPSPFVTSSGGLISGATVHPISNFDVEADCEYLRKAMRGVGTDESELINVLASRSRAQRVEIRERFKTMYGKDLMNELKSELSGNFEECLLAMMDPLDVYLARCLRRAMRGAGTDENTLIDILATLSNKDIVAVKKSYNDYYKRDLEKDCVSETSGYFKRLLVSFCQANRDESGSVDMAKATKEAQDLFLAGEKKWGTDESRFNVIFASRGYKQLGATMDEYERMFDRTLLNSMDRELSGEFKEGMKAVALVSQQPALYFAQRLWKSLKGAGTDDSLLIRMIVIRSENDLEDIKKLFLDKYGKTLYDMVDGDCTGDYKKLLLALIKN
eukprot:TRINITY_DN742_c0_g1_i2.p1 TRINITY_DN742_c0_g1~~TRINITY_DN742_c0_g1_i2.p1  ORF type:complete len:562 (+),score=80.53 TRINITY_DN742_c0_g1_i2:91-1776(+)